MKLKIIVGSVRQERVASRLAEWVARTAKQEASGHDWEVVDLKDYDLPMFDEPIPPMGNPNRQVGEKTRQYLDKLDEADGFLVVASEYNHGMPSALKNAIDLVDFQLMGKPVAIVSHGAVGGARSNEQVRLVINSNLGAVPVPKSLPFMGKVPELIDENGQLAEGKEAEQKSLDGVIDSLVWYAEALSAKRNS